MFKVRVLLVLALLLLVGGATVAFVSYQLNRPIGSEGKVEVVVNPGDSIQTIGGKLDKAGLINSAVFILYVRLEGLTAKIQAGHYEIPLTLSPLQVVELLQHGNFDIRITFFEGWRKEEYLDYVLRKLAVNDNQFRLEFLSETRNFEGYLFPDTYVVPINISATDLVAILRDNFKEKYAKSVAPLVVKSGLTEKQVVTIASMLERETSRDATMIEMRTVAGILIKRWRSGWRLEVDATVQYALGYQAGTGEWWKNKLTHADLQINSPYNTYQEVGLPPAPIANPGLNALLAAANPKDSSYWFYLHDKEGHIHYARTLEEHNQNVLKYLR